MSNTTSTFTAYEDTPESFTTHALLPTEYTLFTKHHNNLVTEGTGGRKNPALYEVFETEGGKFIDSYNSYVYYVYAADETPSNDWIDTLPLVDGRTICTDYLSLLTFLNKKA